jgi:hypothetical protein
MGVESAEWQCLNEEQRKEESKEKKRMEERG